jgi:hypothetical protein
MMDDEREFSPWRLWTSAGLMIGFAALGLALLFNASDRSTAASVRAETQVRRPIEATPASSVVAKPIEQVQAGERVLSRDEHTGELVFRPVAQTFVRTSDHLRLLTLRTSAGVDEQIETTDEHPFWVEGTGWTAAKSLQAGQRLTEPDGSITTVVASGRVEQPDGVTVYNFEVQDTHSYFVAARGSRGPPVWVHNANGYAPGVDEVTVYRVQVRQRSGAVTGGAFLRAREGGATTAEAFRKRQTLLSKVNSPDPDVRVRALQNAQASGRDSPFISTTFDRAGAESHLAAMRANGIDAELITIVGPRSGGVDFETAFRALGGRTKPNRFKDAELQEFGIADLFVPRTGSSPSGFRIIDRR